MSEDMSPMSMQFPSTEMVGVDVFVSDSIQEHIRKTKYWVAASDFEVTKLYQHFAKQEEKTKEHKRYHWYNSNIVVQIQIGKYGTHPIVIIIRWATINGIQVGFFESNGCVVHFEMMDHFLRLVSASFRCGLHCNVENFESRIHDMQTDIQRFEYVESLVVIAKQKQMQEDIILINK